MIDHNTLLSRISNIEKELPKLSSALSAMIITNTSIYGQNYEELSLDAAIRAERIACSLRNLIYAANLVSKPSLMKRIAREHNIVISHTDDMVIITLPGLLPKRTKRINTTFLTDPLYYSLESYVIDHKLPRYRDCVVCFTHVFDENLSERRVRDYDNLECKQILDTVSGFLMIDDSGLLCDAYHTTDLGDRDYTQLTIMNRECFPIWLRKQTDKGNCISDF